MREKKKKYVDKNSKILNKNKNTLKLRRFGNQKIKIKL